MSRSKHAAAGLAAIAGLALASAPGAAATPKKEGAPVKTAARKPAATGPAAGKGDVTRTQMQAQVKRTFDRADTNHDGYMSRAEFGARMGIVLSRPSTASLSKEDVQSMLDAANRAFDDVDANHDGKLSLGEASMRPLKAFDMMDANHDGILTLAEKAAAHRDGPVGPTIGEAQGPGR